MAKRAATSVLDQDNWDKEDEPEDPGVFQTASSEVLQTRVIKTAKRRIRTCENEGSEGKPSPFSGFSGFGKAASKSNATSPFSFLSQPKSNANTKDNNGTGSSLGPSHTNLTCNSSSSPVKTLSNSSFLSVGGQREVTSSASSDSVKAFPLSTDSGFKPFEHIFKAKADNEGGDKNKTNNLELLKDLNLSCSKWISEHVEKNPYCILTPIFKDYEKHLNELNLNKNQEKKDHGGDSTKNNNNNEKVESVKPFPVENSNLQSQKPFSFLKNDNVVESNQANKKESENETSGNFKLGEFQPAKPFSFQFGGNTTFDSTSSTFNLNSIAAKPVHVDSEGKKDDEESEEPPKNDFVPVVEEDSVYDIKCKVFVKKDGNFVSRGVGTLFLKPVQGSAKTQVVVRAHTNLGNILLNFLLSSDIPIQKTGKNNVVLACVPTPEAKPPPVPVLIRVKTSDECDALIKKLEECKRV